MKKLMMTCLLFAGLVATAQEEATDSEAPSNGAAPMSTDVPQVKSEKVTSEVFYQLSKEEFSAMIVEFGRQVESVKAELKAEIETKLSEPISLTKTKPAKESASQNAYEKFREFNKQFK